MRDICGLQVPGKLRSEIDQRTIDAVLPPETQYACQYWVHYLKEGRSTVQDGGPVHSFLTSHLLHWLEALSLLGRISESISMVDDLLTFLHVCYAPLVNPTTLTLTHSPQVLLRYLHSSVF